MSATTRVAFVSQPRTFVSAGPVQRDSVAIVTMELARRLGQGFDIRVYAPRSKGEPARERSPEGIQIRRIGGILPRVHKVLELTQMAAGIGTPYFASDLYHHQFIAAVARDLAQEPVDLVHLQTFAQFLPVLRKALPRTRLVIHLHDEGLAALPPALVRQRLDHADAVVTCSHYIARRVEERLPRLQPFVQAVGNGVDTALFRPPVETAEEEERLLFVGRISPEKGVHVLLEAVALLAKRRPRLTLDLAGGPGLITWSYMRLLLNDRPVGDLVRFYGYSPPGRLLRRADSYANRLRKSLPVGLRERVRFLGAQRQDRLPSLYGKAALCVFPSIWQEPFGIPLVEAMACGKATVASRSGEFQTIIEDGVSGRLVERADVESLVQGLDQLLDDPQARNRMGRMARERVLGTYRWEHCRDRLLEVYERLRPGAGPVC
jgi:glycosyltransferase involved in cell wall biosynthesis